MKNISAVVLTLSIVMLSNNPAWSQGVTSTFTYQGILNDGGSPAHGMYDLVFKLYDSAEGNIQVGGTLTKENVGVYSGYFTVQLDFGSGIFPGDARWLQIAVRPGDLADPNVYTPLSPRQEVTPTPYALYAAHAETDTDWVVAPPDMHAGVTGNVGIGVMVPGYKLDVAGDIKGTSGRFGTDQLLFGADLQAANRINIMDYATDNPNLLIGDSITQCLQLRWDSMGDHAQLYTPAPYHIAFMPGGNVGIGTIDPEETLDVRGNLELDQKILAHDSDGLELATDEGTTRLFIADDGNVGIGTTNPVFRLEVKSTGYTDGLRVISSDDDQLFRVRENSNGSGQIQISDSEGDVGVLISGDSKNYFNSGNVGIGTTEPGAKLDVVKPYGLTDPILNLATEITSSPISTWEFLSLDGTSINASKTAGNASISLNDFSAGDVYLAAGGGRVGVGTTNPQSALDVAGWTRTEVLEITGGSDLAEPFDMSCSDSIVPGMVVCIDPQNPGDLVISSKSYDRRVAGIVSGAGGIKPGMVMRQKGSQINGSIPVALTGRVYCLTDASNGPVQPGDLLTTSDVPGHAMKVTDYPKAQGAIIGKALTPLKQGQGLVLVLVALH